MNPLHPSGTEQFVCIKNGKIINCKKKLLFINSGFLQNDTINGKRPTHLVELSTNLGPSSDLSQTVKK